MPKFNIPFPAINHEVSRCREYGASQGIRIAFARIVGISCRFAFGSMRPATVTTSDKMYVSLDIRPCPFIEFDGILHQIC